MKGLFQEKKEFYFSLFNTKEGLFEFAIHTLIWGYFIIEYTPVLYGKIFNFLDFLSPFIQTWVAYMGLGIVLIPIGMIITWILTKIFGIFFKNGRILR